MTQALSEPKILTLEDFLDWYPDGYGHFELHSGNIVHRQPTGTHEQVGGELAAKLILEINRLKRPYLIPRQCIIKPLNSETSGYSPDIAVVDKTALTTEPIWKKRSTLTRGESLKLVVEVVSTNWQDDYSVKLGEYEKLGIAEYWIVDYLGLGGKRYIGDPKQPTLSVYQMVEGEYLVKLFRGSEPIESGCFPELNLTAEEVLNIEE
jgi:Uma2 family endonuclease